MPFAYTKKEGLAVLVPSSSLPPPPLPDQGLKKPTLRDGSDQLDSEDAYLMVDDEFQVENEDRSEIVHSLYEGPRTCQCCTNWVDKRPDDIYERKEEKIDEKAPILVRRKRISDGSKVFQIDSIEIQSAPLRLVLAKVFNRYDHIVPTIGYLTFRPPFWPFYWRWEEFETAIKEVKNEKLSKQLKCLRNLVKSEMSGLFTVSRELQDNGVIEHRLLWTLFKPGELLYSKEHGREKFYVLCSVSQYANISLSVRSLDWNGRHLGFSTSTLSIRYFNGTSRITDLNIFPARFLDNLEEVKQRILARGKRFIELAGVHHKSYRDQESGSGNKSGVDLRIMIDAEAHPREPVLTSVYEQDAVPLHSGLISQIPPAAEPPPGCHIPLATVVAPLPPPPPPPPGVCEMPPPPPMAGRPPPPPPAFKKRKAPRSMESSIEELEEERHEIELSEFHFLLANPRVRGFRLKDKEWADFDIDGVHDIHWNPDCFDTSLVLPDGYKDLVLAHVENQLNGEESFDDVINGKGGGLVILLSGPPGVGKTLTVESVAERMKAPLYKIELHTGSIFYDSDEQEEEIEESFNRAVKWDAVLLIDECDTYLQRRSDSDSMRNRIVAAFLQNLEYYPSLLFLTTNRANSLDIALQSRVDLTINYPNLDFPSRLAIWRNFLFGRGLNTKVSDKELEMLAQIELNGRRIKNVVKTSLVMAKSLDRELQYEDVEKVLRITEGLTLTE